MSEIDPGEAPPKAGPMEVRRAIRTAARRRKADPEINYLNITAMMDMMTIILVFLIMSFGAASTTVAPSPDLTVPYSRSRDPVREALRVTITRRQILVDQPREATGGGGGDQEVCALANGRVDASQKRDGANGFFITPLYNALIAQRDRMRLIAQHNAQFRFEGIITIIADRSIQYRTLTEVLYTAGQAEFGNYRLVVLQQPGGAPPAKQL